MKKAIKIRIYPTEEQAVLIEKTFGCCRWMWNAMLNERQEAYKTTGETIHPTPAKYKDKEHEWLKEVDSLALCNVQRNQEKSYKAFFDGIKGKAPKRGLPKFKKKKVCKRSYTTNNQTTKSGDTIAFKDGFLKLPKLGLVQCNMYRALPNCSIGSVTISEPVDGEYYASISFDVLDENGEAVTVQPAAITTDAKFIGLDYASNGLYVDSEGNNCKIPHFYRKGQKKLAKLQRRMSKKKKGSKNRDKARNRVRKQQAHVANQRLDYLHKKSTEIANQYDVVCVEDINMAAISRSLRLGKATMDNGFGMFRTFLEYKLAERGKVFIKVDKFFPSTQLCHKCGYKNPATKDLKVLEWDCPNCRTHHDRNINAAINIREEGKRVLLGSVAA